MNGYEQRVISGAHYKKPVTLIISQRNGIFTDQSILRDFSGEIDQFQSTRARFEKDKTMWPRVHEHVDMSPLVCAHDCNWSLRFLWRSEFETNSN